MAIFLPCLEEIKNDKMEKHTSGELELLEELTKLDDSFSIYFQSHINFAHPDVIVEKKGCGVLIIEVKDWQLSTYTFHDDDKRDKYGYLTVSGKPSHLSTPFQQVQEYKDELFNVQYHV